MSAAKTAVVHSAKTAVEHTGSHSRGLSFSVISAKSVDLWVNASRLRREGRGVRRIGCIANGLALVVCTGLGQN